MEKEKHEDKSSTLHLCLVSCFPPSRGPLSEYTYHLAKHLSKNPKIAKITVLADESAEENPHLGEKVEVIKCWKLNDPLASWDILRRVYKLKPDLVHFNLLFRHFSANRVINFLGLCTPALVKLLGFPVVTTLHSISEVVDLTEVGYRNTMLNRLGSWLATKLLLKSSVVTLTHQHFVDIVRQKYGAKNIVHIPHGVFYEPITRCNFEGERFLLFGKMGHYKNLGLALEAFQEVLNNDRKAELLIAGPPHPLNPGLVKQVLEKCKGTPNVRVLGYIAESELKRLFTSSIAVIMPYTISTWSSGVFNIACAYGRPVIASNLPDFRELREEGAGIILFPKNDREALAKTMKMILHDKELQRKLGRANIEWAKEHSFNQTVDRLVKIFEKLVKSL